MDFGVILFIFNCWMNWWMWMIEIGIIRFLEKKKYENDGNFYINVVFIVLCVDI